MYFIEETNNPAFAEHREIKIQVHAPKLLFLSYHGETVPIFSFRAIVPVKIKLTLRLDNSIDQLYLSLS